MRSYDEYCAAAKSLDVVGDRWTLLIVRELLLKGRCRYTDLRNGLPGIATNLLADRLRELEQVGVVAREDAPPPIATTLFSLTDRGRELQPILESLVRWGLPLMLDQKPADVVQSHWLAWALELMLTDHEPEAPAVTIELRTGGEPIVVRAADGVIHASTASADDPDAILTGETKPIMGLLVGLIDLAEAQAGGVGLDGESAVVARIRNTSPPFVLA